MVQNTELVIAIDFGTTFSGFVYALLDDNVLRKGYPKDCTSWENLELIIPNANTSRKTITSLLYSVSDKQYLKWAAEAHKQYLDLAQEHNTEMSKYVYAKRYKTQLTSNEYYQDEFNNYARNVNLPVLDLVANTLKFIKNKALRVTQNIIRSNNISENSIKWVISVPVSWSGNNNDGVQGRDLMRQAAVKAGLVTKADDKKRLWLISEPEAASIWCSIEKPDDLPSDNNLAMILDCGGGTTDILTFEVKRALAKPAFQQVIESTAKQCGSKKLDDEFIKFMIFNHLDLWEEIVQDPASYMDIFNRWENYKVTHDPDMSATDEGFQLKSNRTQFTNSFSEDHRFSRTDFESLFDEGKEHIKLIFQQIQEQLNQIRELNRNCENLLVVGGYSRSKMLRKKLKEKFPDLNISFPDPNADAVLKGAVYFGVNPGQYRRRIFTHTYGMEYLQPFDKNLDDPNYKIWRPFSGDLCSHRFIPFIKKGDVIEAGKPIKILKKELRKDRSIQKIEIIKLEIYKTDQENIRYTRHNSCEHISTIHIAKPQGCNSKDWEVVIEVFCDTEGEIQFEICSRDKSGNKAEYTNVNII